MSVLSRAERLALAAIIILTVLAGSAEYGGWPAVPSFALATLSLAGLAWIVSFATEQLGERFGPGVTGMLQSTLGNLPELFVVIFALQKGETVVAQTALIGSIFANALLVLGLVLVVGSRRAPDGIMRFSVKLPKDTATLLQVTVFIIVLLGLSLAAHDPASHHVDAISAVGAVCLLVVYGTWVVPYLRSDRAPGAEPRPAGAPPDGGEPALESEPAPRAPPVAAVHAHAADHRRGGLGVRLGLVRQRAEPAIVQLHISQAFAGLVIVAIAGNAVENVAGVVLAHKGRSDLAISVVKNSVAQIAAFLFPLLVLVSFALKTPPDVRARARLHRGAGADRARARPDHRRRGGRRIRGLGARRPVRDPRHGHAL